jgi:hypothetical protein
MLGFVLHNQMTLLLGRNVRHHDTYKSVHDETVVASAAKKSPQKQDLGFPTTTTWGFW